MIESTYDSCLFYKFESLNIVNLQIDDILMLINDVFAIEKENAIKTINIMTKKRIFLIFDISIKFNDIMIRLVSNEDIMLSQKTRIESILLMKNYEISIFNSRDIVREKLSLIKQYVTQRARDAYISSICQCHGARS